MNLISLCKDEEEKKKEIYIGRNAAARNTVKVAKDTDRKIFEY
jgi:hypothetical protein